MPDTALPLHLSAPSCAACCLSREKIPALERPVSDPSFANLDYAADR